LSAKQRSSVRFAPDATAATAVTRAMRGYTAAVPPPSTAWIVPVTNADRSETR